MKLRANGRRIQSLLGIGIVIVSSALAGCGGSSSDSSSGDQSSASTSATASTPSTNAVATVALSSPDYVVNASSTAIVTIYRSGSTTGSATVGYGTINGTATAGTDYTATEGTVTWQDGDGTAKTVIVPVTTAASGKNFSISLTNVEGQATFGSPSSALIQVATVAGSSSSSSGGSSSSSGSSTASASSSSSGSTTTSSSSGTTTSATGTASLSWTAPTENTNGTALTNLAGYNIYYGTSTSTMTNKININTVGMLTYVIDNMTSGNWYFAVTSVNSAGVESVLTTTIEAKI